MVEKKLRTLLEFEGVMKTCGSQTLKSYADLKELCIKKFPKLQEKEFQISYKDAEYSEQIINITEDDEVTEAFEIYTELEKKRIVFQITCTEASNSSANILARVLTFPNLGWEKESEEMPGRSTIANNARFSAPDLIENQEDYANVNEQISPKELKKSMNLMALRIDDNTVADVQKDLPVEYEEVKEIPHMGDPEINDPEDNEIIDQREENIKEENKIEENMEEMKGENLQLEDESGNIQEDYIIPSPIREIEPNIIEPYINMISPPQDDKQQLTIKIEPPTLINYPMTMKEWVNNIISTNTELSKEPNIDPNKKRTNRDKLNIKEIKKIKNNVKEEATTVDDLAIIVGSKLIEVCIESGGDPDEMFFPMPSIRVQNKHSECWPEEVENEQIDGNLKVVPTSWPERPQPYEIFEYTIPLFNIPEPGLYSGLFRFLSADGHFGDSFRINLKVEGKHPVEKVAKELYDQGFGLYSECYRASQLTKANIFEAQKLLLEQLVDVHSYFKYRNIEYIHLYYLENIQSEYLLLG